MSGKIAGLTEKANEITADNDNKITAASQSMEKISASTDDTCDMILSLAAQSKKIAAISNVISDISTQTNILAINASIEASHAGEAGSGFAVVATAAEEIGDIISAVTNGVEKAADAMKHNAALTREGVSDMETIRRSAEHIGASNKEVTQNIEDMNSVISNVFANSETVTRELGTVSHNITGNSDALQHVAAAIEENSAGTQTLDSMVKQIKSMAAELEQLTE
jgi:methyl-accepting chemotaxis protein